MEQEGRNSARYEQASRLIHQAVDIILETPTEGETGTFASASSSASVQAPSTAVVTSFIPQQSVTTTETYPPLQTERAASSFIAQQPGTSGVTNANSLKN
eukprot:Seg2631.2 transcript_id=Seg2631.2/GoldUCD/mRNA.D3Y31 product="hypothetical protein" protein_id=Seg2631.2/GoldUCD/D3Y31